MLSLNLHDPGRHIPLRARPWSQAQAEDGARQIVRDVLARLEPGGFWPPHKDEPTELKYEKALYSGAAGTLWALIKLAARLKVDLPFDAAKMASRILEAYFAEPDTGSTVPSYFLGESGILHLCNLITPNEGFKMRLRGVINDNVRNPANEALWGCPGTMIPALHIGAIDLYQASANYLFEEWRTSGNGPIWEQDLYGKTRKFIGAGHGFAGNVQALLVGQQHLTESQRKLLFERTAFVLTASARREEGCANWMPSFELLGDPRPPLVQWCHGAPGVITSLRKFPKDYSAEFEQLLLEAGETTWQAGPLSKGIGICHGTDGNGFALLQLFERTQDRKWLDRARAFAMQALTQRNGRSTLWTGEMGLALYLMACVDEQAGFPCLDYF